MEAYHDLEWGVPLHDDRALFELLTLEGAQAGLSWMTILRRRGGYRRAFANFDIEAVAEYGSAELERLLGDDSIVRHRQKLESTIANAKRAQEIQREHGSLDAYLWSFVEGRTLVHDFAALRDIPAQTAESARMSKALRGHGFGFVGPTICYAFMQSAGLVNDHMLSCPRRAELMEEARPSKR
jgi:DNA-3-methyladenine glycosylase I